MTDLELKSNNVINVYNDIANHFDVTRAYVWKSVKEFVSSIPSNSYILDAGCGNGKNMFRKDCFHIGIDNSSEMVKICHKKNYHVINADITQIPFKNNYFDAVTCIAVIHHIPNNNDKIRAIKELVRVTKKNGRIFIQVWDNNLSQRNRSKYHKINGRNGEYLIEWSKNDKIYYRYYHLLGKEEVLSLISNIKDIVIKKFYNELDNWVLLLEKV